MVIIVSFWKYFKIQINLRGPLVTLIWDSCFSFKFSADSFYELAFGSNQDAIVQNYLEIVNVDNV